MQSAQPGSGVHADPDDGRGHASRVLSVLHGHLHALWLCLAFGNDIPGEISDFGRNNEYGSLYGQTFTTMGGGYQVQYNLFDNFLRDNPCEQPVHGAGLGTGQ